MGWRFRKRIKILPGVHVNISKSGVSTNVGVRGASVTFGPKGTYVNTGIPGTGLYRRDKVSPSKNEENTNSFLNYSDSTIEKAGKFNKIVLKLIGGVLLFLSIITLTGFISYLFTADIDQRIIESMMAGDIPNSKLEFQNICGGWGAYTSWFFISRCFGYPAFLIPFFILVVSLKLIGLLKLNLWKYLFSFMLIMVWGSVFFAEFINPLLNKNVFNAGGYYGANIALVLEKNIGIFGLTSILVIVAVAFYFYIIHQRATHINEKDSANLTVTNNVEDGEKEKDIDDNTILVTKPTEGTTREETNTTSDTVDNTNNSKRRFVEESGEKEGEKDIPYPYSSKMDLEDYRYPTLDLLNKYDSDRKPQIDMEEQQAKKYRIVDLLRSVGVEISSIKTTIGPRITLYEITLANGLNASKLRGLEDDIALALCSYKVTIAPIPGKGTIGIEVPNTRQSVLSLESVFNTISFQDTTMELPCAIGKTITNEVFMFDLTKAPHLLIAGSTGQGKSVTLNTLITSLLYKKHPAELKLVLMDPYGVEFGVYAQIANHFLASLPGQPAVVSNCSKAVNTLNSLCKEMEHRFKLLKMAYVRNIKEYNNKFIDRQLNPSIGHRYMPYIVVFIDEYGDFIEEKGQDFETPIVKLTHYGRAIGIHLVISTKRPTNDIITGAIKANIPTRIAFRLPERIDSQVILDCDGAEKLIGNGDMLFRAGKSVECIRVQGAFADTNEIERIIRYISYQDSSVSPFELPDPFNNEEDYLASDVDMQHLDPLFEDAARLLVSFQDGSTSLIQRKFAIEYNRAGRLMDQLEKAGIVSNAHGSKPREVLIPDEKSLEKLLNSLL